jgi:hypothetical protein
MDEVELLEDHMGSDGSAWLRSVLETLPLAAVAECGAVFTHGAPAAAIESLRDLENAELNSDEWDSPLDILDVPIVGPILWARSATRTEARRFAKAMGARFTIYGHDVIPEGFERIGDEQMIVSTSFGVFDENKVYISLDLAARYDSVLDLRIGHEILPLYPAKAASSLGGIAD